MKRKEFLKQVKGLDAGELRSRIRANSEEQMKLRFRQATGQLQQSHRLGILRKERARLLTFARMLSDGAVRTAPDAGATEGESLARPAAAAKAKKGAATKKSAVKKASAKKKSA